MESDFKQSNKSRSQDDFFLNKKPPGSLQGLIITIAILHRLVVTRGGLKMGRGQKNWYFFRTKPRSPRFFVCFLVTILCTKKSKNAVKHVILAFKMKGDVISDHFLMLRFQKDSLDTFGLGLTAASVEFASSSHLLNRRLTGVAPLHLRKPLVVVIPKVCNQEGTDNSEAVHCSLAT